MASLPREATAETGGYFDWSVLLVLAKVWGCQLRSAFSAAALPHKILVAMRPEESNHLRTIYDRIQARRGEYKRYLLSRYSYDVDRTIAPDDVMAHDGLEWYMLVGASAVHAIDIALQSAARTTDSVQRILDLPCGHGRVLRALRAVFPDKEIVACDIERGGVDFCAQQFDAAPAYSRPDVDALELPGQFDLIWVGSLLTHVDASAWRAFLRLFERVMVPGGVLVMTTAGRLVADTIRAGEYGGLDELAAAEMLTSFDETGFGYAAYESDDAAQSEAQSYGRAIATPAWVCSVLAEFEGLRLISLREQAWDLRQDVVALVRE